MDRRREGEKERRRGLGRNLSEPPRLPRTVLDDGYSK